MDYDVSPWVGERLTPAQRKNWRLLVALAGALLLMASYLLPMFSQRIISGTTRYTGGTVLEKDYQHLVSDLHLALGETPLREEFASVEIKVAPVSGFAATGWGWLLRTLANTEARREHISFALCLAWPLLSTFLVLFLVLRAWFGPRGIPERLIPPTISYSGLAVAALLLTWLHQFDFSRVLFALEPKALLPGVGLWLAVAGALAMFVSTLRLRQETRRPILNWWALVFAVALLLWLLTRAKPYPFMVIWRFVSDGILVTLRIVATSFGFILLVSLLGGLGRISKSKIIYGLSSLYVEVVRGIPLMVQLLFIWFALPQVFDVLGDALLKAAESAPPLAAPLSQAGQWLMDLRLSPFTAAVVGLTVCYGAYGSEIFRAGISSIHHGQMEAARSLGMTYIQAMRHVILPQAVRVILPPIGNEFVALLKDSSLVSVLAVSDLTRRGREYMARTFQSFDTWILVALCYLVLTLFSSRAVEYIESKTKIGR